MDNLRVSIVIVTRNAKQVTLACLESVFTEVADCEVVVVDNGSFDGTAQSIRDRFPTARVIENRENVGFGRANNVGATASSGEFILFLNNDTIAQPGSVKLLADALDSDDNLGLAAPQLVDSNGGLQETVAHLVTPATELRRGARKRAQAVVRSAVARGKPLGGLAYLSGAALMVRRAAFERVGGFDESFFLYYEDMDLCKRISDRGWGMRFVPEARIVHLGGSSTRHLSVAVTVELMRSRFIYLRKHFGRNTAAAAAVAWFFGRMRRALVDGLGAALTLGLNAHLRERALVNAAAGLWFLLGMPARDRWIYRRLFCDWHA